MKQYTTDALKAKFKLAETKCKKAYTNVTSKENGLIDGSTLGSFYRYVNSKLVHKTGIGVLVENGSYIYDDQNKTKILNDFQGLRFCFYNRRIIGCYICS